MNDFETESEEIARLKSMKRMRLGDRRKENKAKVRRIEQRQDRYVNWDQVIIGDIDLYDEAEAKNADRIRNEKADRQKDDYEARRMCRLKNKQFDFSLSEEDPYIKLHNTVVEAAGRTERNTYRADEDRQVIHDNWAEINRMLSDGVTMSQVAREFELSYFVLRRVLGKKKG